jgi:probable rRNA maturation factor
MIRIAIASPQKIVPIDRTHFRRVARVVLKGEGIQAADLSLAFVDNATIHSLNQRFLAHDEPTDVLSFPLLGGASGELQGELIIGVEVARAEAVARGHDVQAELTLYVIHGLLHLCGLDDQTTAGTKAMREREKHYLAKLGLPAIGVWN